MNLNDILQLKFPTVSFLKDIILQDDGHGVYIKEWNLDNIARPTKEDLDKWAVENDLPFRQHQARAQRIYPSLEDQEDMKYHDATEGTTTWIDAITAIKVAHPIPEE